MGVVLRCCQNYEQPSRYTWDFTSPMSDNRAQALEGLKNQFKIQLEIISLQCCISANVNLYLCDIHNQVPHNDVLVSNRGYIRQLSYKIRMQLKIPLT